MDEVWVRSTTSGFFSMKVQSREDMPVVLDLGSVGHRITQSREYLDDAVFHERYGVARADMSVAARTRHVVDSGRAGILPGADRALQLLDTRHGRTLQTVEFLPQLAFELGSNSLELIHQRRYLALFAQQSYAELLDLSGRSGSE